MDPGIFRIHHGNVIFVIRERNLKHGRRRSSCHTSNRRHHRGGRRWRSERGGTTISLRLASSFFVDAVKCDSTCAASAAGCQSHVTPGDAHRFRTQQKLPRVDRWQQLPLLRAGRVTITICRRGRIFILFGGRARRRCCLRMRVRHLRGGGRCRYAIKVARETCRRRGERRELWYWRDSRFVRAVPWSFGE